MLRCIVISIINVAYIALQVQEIRQAALGISQRSMVIAEQRFRYSFTLFNGARGARTLLQKWIHEKREYKSIREIKRVVVSPNASTPFRSAILPENFSPRSFFSPFAHSAPSSPHLAHLPFAHPQFPFANLLSHPVSRQAYVIYIHYVKLRFKRPT